VSTIVKLVPVLSVAIFAVFAGGSTAPVAAGGAGCHQEPTPRDAAGDTVLLEKQCFGPTVLRVNPGSQVTFKNNDAMAHHIAGVAMNWATTGELRQGETASFTFDTAGTYPYSCYLHVGMSGVIVVGDGVSSGARGEVTKAISSQEQARNLSAPGSSPPAGAAGAAVAAAVSPASGDDESPFLFAAFGALVGGVAVALAAAARGMRSRR